MNFEFKKRASSNEVIAVGKIEEAITYDGKDFYIRLSKDDASQIYFELKEMLLYQPELFNGDEELEE